MSSIAGRAQSQLQGHWQDIQKNTFTRWANEHLRDRGYHFNDLVKDVKDGILLCNLLEIISGKKIGAWNKHPRVPLHKKENCAIAVDFIQREGLKLVNISGNDISEGNEKLILGLLWTLILRYQINKKGGNDGENDLLRWVQSKIPSYGIKNFTGDWNDGRAINGLVNALQPNLCTNHGSLSPANGLSNATQGIETAERNMGIAPLILPAEMVHPKVDKLAMMTYISQFRDWEENGKQKVHPSQLVQAYGPGLTEGVAKSNAPFWVNTQGQKGKLDVKVTGPGGKSVPCSLVEDSKTPGKFSASYIPGEAGDYQVAITFDGEHIPGSVFHVTVLAAISLGGEGKIRVFFSTTASSEKGRQDNFSLERILHAKKVHLRTDFEPWVPVDILEKEDRELVFLKAGTRKLPIVFINDEFVGDYDKLEELEEVGELEPLLNTLKATFLSEEEAARRVNPYIDGGASAAQLFNSMSISGGSSSSSSSSKPAVGKVTVSGTTSGGVSHVSGGAGPGAGAGAGASFCPNCGAKATGGKFCGSCGTSLA